MDVMIMGKKCIAVALCATAAVKAPLDNHNSTSGLYLFYFTAAVRCYVNWF